MSVDSQLFDDEEYERWLPWWGDGPKPLWSFDKDYREHIEYLVAQPTPPPKWIGNDDCQITSRAWYEWHRARGNDPRKQRERLPAQLRRAVIERDGYVCRLCSEPVEEDDIHIDHILPRKHGGRDVLGNLQVAHSFCNLSKGARVLEVATDG